MKSDVTKNPLQFLNGSGEMAMLTRSKDWSNSPVSNPDTWPQSLRTALSIILNSKFPMFLWWGPQLTCFYNDAYRPSLGQEGKHPAILGMPAKQAWPEIWDVISPLINQVLAGGEATWSEDQLIPIFRNGKMEDVYWTFSYSPAYDESNKVAGVMVICSETTKTINTLKSLEESNRRFYNNIKQAPSAMCVFKGPRHIVEIANDLMLELWGKTAEEVINKPIFNGLPEARGQGLETLLDTVFKTGEKFVANERSVNLPRNGKNETIFVNFVYEALKEPNGEISGIVAVATEVTRQIMARRLIEDSEKRFRNMVQQAPLGITILRGKDFVPEIANETYLQLVDKHEKDFVGIPLFKSLPEVKEVVEPLLNNVLNTGEAFYAPELSVMLNRFGKKELGYFNIVYHPLREENNITGIIVVATEVSETVHAKKILSESEKQFRNLITQSPIPMTIFMGKDHIIEMANTVMFEKIWRRKESDVIGKSILEAFPELKEQKYPQLLHEVYQSGKTHTETESIAYVKGNDGMKKFYLDYEYSPLFDTENKVAGIMVTVNDVTEKVEARKKIEDGEERLRLATEATNLSTWDLDLLTNEIIHSPRLAEIFGHDRSVKITHDKMREQIHEADRSDIVEKAFEKAMTTSLYEYESRVIKPNKEIIWVRTQGKVFFDSNYKPFKMLGTLKDITEERYNRQALEEREQKFRLLADSMSQFVWTSDVEGNLNYFNQSVYNYTGFAYEQMYNDGWLRIVHPDDRDRNTKQWKLSVVTGKDFLFEHRFRNRNGQYHWHLSRAVPQKDTSGNIQMWVGTSTDIQDQKNFAAELEKQVKERTIELKKSEERYHLMVEEVQDYAIIYLNREGIVENWNKGAEKIKGYTAEEIVGKSFSVFYTENDRENNLPQKLLQRALTSGKAIQEGWRVRKDKSVFWASVVITAVHDEENNVIGFSKVTHDLSEKKEADDKIKLHTQQLSQKNSELEKMNAELQSFAYVSSHDLQEPLRKIQTFASRIEEKEANNLSDNGKDYFRRMQQSANRMQTLILDLLAYSRTNTTDRVFTTTNLDDIFKDVKNEFKETISEKNAIVEAPEMANADVIQFQIRQLLHNLIGNALKFSKPGVAPHVIVKSKLIKGNQTGNKTLDAEKTYCHLSVSDNGIGFDPQYKERIFEVFQRLHNKDHYSGTGIGLAIVKKIVENHNGIITASGEINKGVTFDIYFPAY